VVRSPEAKIYMIGQFTSLLNHCASLLPFIAEDEDKHERYHVWVACTNSFTTDFRALYYFMFRPNSLDADRTDFVSPTHWKPSETAVTQRLKEFATFIDKHRAHLSWERFDSGRSGLSSSSEHRDSVKPRGKVPDYYLSEDRLKTIESGRLCSCPRRLSRCLG
jgi:hypothetical protein